MPDGIGLAVRMNNKGVIEGGFEKGRPAMTYKLVLKQPPKYTFQANKNNRVYHGLNVMTPEDQSYTIQLQYDCQPPDRYA